MVNKFNLCWYQHHIVFLDKGQFGMGSGHIFLDDVACFGSESNLLKCCYNNHHNCRHSEDAGVICSTSEYVLFMLLV